MDLSSTSSEISFHGLLIKANVLVSENSIVIIITVIKQPTAERYLANIFSPLFLWTFRKLLQRIKKMFRKFLESSQNTRDKGLF